MLMPLNINGFKRRLCYYLLAVNGQNFTSNIKNLPNHFFFFSKFVMYSIFLEGSYIMTDTPSNRRRIAELWVDIVK